MNRSDDHPNPSTTTSSERVRQIASVSDRLGALRRMPADKAALWLSGLFIILYLAAVGPHWYITRDSALYLMLAENLTDGRGYTLFGHPHAFVPPGFPLILSGLMTLGLKSYVWLNLSVAVMGLLTVLFAYLFLRKQASPWIALTATALFGLGFVMHNHSVLLLSDVPFALTVTFGLYAYSRSARGDWPWLIAGTVSLVASCWIRVVGFPLALAAGAGLLLESRGDNRRRLWITAGSLAISTALTLVFFQFWYHQAQGSLPSGSYAPAVVKLWERPILDWLWAPLVHFYETGSALSRLIFGDRVPNVLALALVWAPIFLGASVIWRRGQYLGLAAVAGYLGAILALRSLLCRYLIPVAPLLALFYVEGLHHLLGMRPAWRRQALQRTMGLILLLLMVHTFKDVRRAYEMHRPEFIAVNPQWQLMSEAATQLRELAMPGAIFTGTNDRRVLSYLSGVPFLDFSSKVYDSRFSPPELRQMLYDENVRFVILRPDENHPFQESLRDLIAESTDFQMVYRNSRYEMFRWVPQPKIATRLKTRAGP